MELKISDENLMKLRPCVQKTILMIVFLAIVQTSCLETRRIWGLDEFRWRELPDGDFVPLSREENLAEQIKEEYPQMPIPEEYSPEIVPIDPEIEIVDDISGLGMKPVGFTNLGIYHATVSPWTYIPPKKDAFYTPPSVSTVSMAQGPGGEWPNTSRFLSVPMGTYTWCIDWDQPDEDEEGYSETYHYIYPEKTFLDEHASEDMALAKEVYISAPPRTGQVFKGRCGDPIVEDFCEGKTTHVETHIRWLFDPSEVGFRPPVVAKANTGYQSPPAGINISVTGNATDWYDWKILWEPGHWIEATTSDPYRAMGVQIFGDNTIGWARVLFDGALIWEGDTSAYVISETDGYYGIYIEVRCFPPGTHSLRVEAGQPKEGVGGWRGGVPVHSFLFRW